MSECLYKSDRAEAWHGNSLLEADINAVMAGRIADALILDAPFSARTHQGHRDGKLTADRAAKFATRETGNARRHERAYAARKAAAGDSGRRDLDYQFWTPGDVRKFCDLWIPRCQGWVVSITDDVLAPAWRTSFVRHGLLPFAPLPLVETGSRVRMSGDGPACWTCWVVVARPRGGKFGKWGSLGGAYVQPSEREINSTTGTDRIVGGKPQQSMQAIVLDYSRHGDLVVDPCAGGFTTGLAALAMGRKFIGLNVNRTHAELGATRLKKAAKQTAMPWSEPAPRMVQADLFQTTEVT